MNLPDSFYIALCMTILLVGAIYWVWTQIQYVQRKVNILENIVYELKTLCAKQAAPEVHIGAIGSSPDAQPSAATIKYPPAPSSVLGEDEDLLHETLSAEVSSAATALAPMEDTDAPVFETLDAEAEALEVTESVFEALSAEEPNMTAPSIVEQFEAAMNNESEGISPFDTVITNAEDLQPGGVGSGVSLTSNNVLEGMNLKELRRLAQQRQIVGANDMRKKELIAALRNATTDGFSE